MPDVVAADPAAQTGANDVALAAGAAAPTGPDDVAAAPVACKCCGVPCAFLPCHIWPPTQIDITLTGLTPPVPCCNDVFVNLGLTFAFSYSVSYPDDACYNRTFSLPLVPSRPDFASPCRWDYQWACEITYQEFDDPIWQALVSVTIFAGPGGITVEAAVSVIPAAFLHAPAEIGCAFARRYRRLYTPEEFACAGSWDLPFDVEIFNGGWTGLPDTLTLTPQFGGTPPDGDFDDCCDLTVTMCKAVRCVETDGIFACESITHQVTSDPDTYENVSACLPACGGGIPPTQRCDTVTGCFDPGDGTGEFTGPTAADDCAAACTPSKWACVAGVCQPTFGGTFDSFEACDASGCGHGDTPIGDDSCCPPESPPPGVMSLVTSCPAAGGCLDLVTSAAWNAALKAFVTGLPACGTFVNLYLFCVGGSINFAIDCGAGLIFAEHIALEDGSGLCGPAAFVHASVTFPGAGVCGGLPPGTSLTMGLGYDASGIVP